MFNLTPTVRNLLFINVLLLVVSNSMPNVPLVEYGALFPVGSPFFQVWQFVTHMFLHGGWGHLISNMFGLVSFGPMLEQRWGAQRFLAFWLICGVGAGALYEGVRYYETSNIARDREELVANPTGGDFAEYIRNYASNNYSSADYFQLAAALQRSPDNPTLQASVKNEATRIYQATFKAPMLGASGALFGLLFAFAYLFPNTELFLLFIPFPIKAKYFVFFYAMYELYAGVHRTPGDNVAHFAHLGGLLIGFIVLKIWERGRNQFY